MAQQQRSNLDDASVLFEPDLDVEFFSEFMNFGPEDNAFFESLSGLSESVLDFSLPTQFDNAINASGIQPALARSDWPQESHDNLDPATVHLPQLNLHHVNDSYQVQLEMLAGSQQPSTCHVPHRQPRDDSPRQQQRVLPALAPQARRSEANLQHSSGASSPEEAKIAKKRTKTYTEEDITCRHCNIKTKTPGELR